MTESTFEQLCSSAGRIAAVRAAAVVGLHGLPQEDRADLEQEVVFELWRKLPFYDPRRGGWRTYAERVAANRLVSLMRCRYSFCHRHGADLPLDSIVCVAPAFDRAVELREDVRRVLIGLPSLDRAVARSLMVHSPVQTASRLGVSRAAVYRAIGRLRTALIAAGLADRSGATDVVRRSKRNVNAESDKPEVAA